MSFNESQRPPQNNLLFKPGELIPSEWKTCPFYPKTFEDIIYIGKENIERFTNYYSSIAARLAAVTADQAYDIDRVRADKAIVRVKEAQLISLKEKADTKPIFPYLRHPEDFSQGDEVICFVGEWERKKPSKILDVDWIVGKVDGMLGPSQVIQFAVPLFNGEQDSGRKGNFHHEDPRLMHRWEFDFFRQEWNYFTLWAENTHEYAPTPISMSPYFKPFIIAGMES